MPPEFSTFQWSAEGGLKSARVFRPAFAPAGTGPRKFRGMRHQASLHRVQFNVVANLLELRCAAHKPIKVLFLPERLADADQQFVRLTGGLSLGTMHQLREHMYVIGHDDIGVKRTETLSHKRLQMISYDPGDLVLPKVDRSHSSAVQQPIQCDEASPLVRCSGRKERSCDSLPQSRQVTNTGASGMSQWGKRRR